MTIVTGSESPSQPADEPVVSRGGTGRAGRVSSLVVAMRQMLVQGFVWCHVVALVCVGLLLATRGPLAAISAALTAAVVVLFYTVGAVVVLFNAHTDPRKLLIWALGSYVARVSALGVLLAAYLANPAWHVLDTPAVVITVVACTLGWVGGELYGFKRARITYYDEPGDFPDDGSTESRGETA